MLDVQEKLPTKGADKLIKEHKLVMSEIESEGDDITVRDVEAHMAKNKIKPSVKAPLPAKKAMWRANTTHYTLPIQLQGKGGKAEQKVLRWGESDPGWLILDLNDAEHKQINEVLKKSRKNGVEFEYHEDRNTPDEIEDSGKLIERLTKFDVAQLKSLFEQGELAEAGISPQTEAKWALIALFIKSGKKL